MKLQEILPNVETSGTLPGPGAIQPSRAPLILAKGIQTVTSELTGLLEDRRRYDEAVARETLRAESGLLTAQVGAQVGLLGKDLETERDPDAYLTKWQNGIDAIRSGMESTFSQGAIAASAPALTRTWGEAEMAARHGVDVRRQDRLAALKDQTAFYYRQQAELVPLADQEGWARVATEAVRAQADESAVATFGYRTATDRSLTEARQLDEARALKWLNEAPGAFLARHEALFTALDPKRREELKAQAVAKLEALDREANRLAKEQEAAVQKQLTLETHSLWVDLTSQANARTLTVPALEAQRELGRFDLPGGKETYQALYQQITAPKDTPSDPGIRAQVWLQVDRPNPTIEVARIWRLHDDYLAGRPGLNFKDAQEAAGKVLSLQHQAKTDAQTQASEARSIQHYDYAQAEAILAKALGMTSPFDQLDAQDKQILAAAQRELFARAAPVTGGGKEDPTTVTQGLIAKYAPLRMGRLDLDIATKARTLQFGGATGIEAARNLQGAAAQGRIQVGSQSWRDELAKINELNALILKREQAAQDAGPTAGGRKPTTKPSSRPAAGQLQPGQ